MKAANLSSNLAKIVFTVILMMAGASHAQTTLDTTSSGAPQVFGVGGQVVGTWTTSQLSLQTPVSTTSWVQVGQTNAACNASTPTLAGAMRWNPTTVRVEVCSATAAGWTSLVPSANGRLISNVYYSTNNPTFTNSPTSGQITNYTDWQHATFSCDPGYHLVMFHYDCTCSNNSNWWECQSN